MCVGKNATAINVENVILKRVMVQYLDVEGIGGNKNRNRHWDRFSKDISRCSSENVRRT